MKALAVSLVAIMIIFVGGSIQFKRMQLQINQLRTDVKELAEAQDNLNKVEYNSRLRSQDQIEERIGTIEHQLDDIVFLLGKKNHK